MSERKKAKGRSRQPKSGKTAPVSLARERRLRELNGVVRESIGSDPAAARRLRGYLAGELPTIKQDRSITIRVPGGLVDRIDALIPALASDPMVAAARGGTTGGKLSVVVRAALMEGLTVLEERYLEK